MAVHVTPIEVVQAVCRGVADAPVVSKVPRNRPGLFVRVDQAAPRVLSPVHQRARVIVQVYGHDLDEVMGLAYELRARLVDVSAHHALAYGCDEVDGPHDVPDPDVPDCFRWQITGLLYMATSA